MGPPRDHRAVRLTAFVLTRSTPADEGRSREPALSRRLAAVCPAAWRRRVRPVVVDDGLAARARLRHRTCGRSSPAIGHRHLRLPLPWSTLLRYREHSAPGAHAT